jgi:hypothetical protein
MIKNNFEKFKLNIAFIFNLMYLFIHKIILLPCR